MQLVVTDDKDEFDSAGKVLTDIGDDGEKVIISLDGQVRELDLTAENAAHLRADMAPWLNAGHAPGQPPQLPAAAQPADQRQQKGQGRRREIPGTRDFLREMREFAEAQGIDVPQNGTRPGKKNYVYSDILKEEYTLHLQARARDGDSVAAARLALARMLGLIPSHLEPLDEPGSPAVHPAYQRKEHPGLESR
jgi:hypothetical protein